MKPFSTWFSPTLFTKTRKKSKPLFRPNLLTLEKRTVPTVAIQTIFPPNYGVTGVRQDIGDNVVITGGTGSPSLNDGTPAFIYYGPLSQIPSDPASPRLHLFYPTFPNETVTGSQFYGPNTPKFDSTIGVGNFTAVGAYRYSESPYQNSMIYTGPLNGSGTYTKIVAPGNGTDPVGDTIAHSTMGSLVVGNFVYQNDLTQGHGFIYDKKDQSYKTVDIGTYGTTIYGIWQNGGETSTNYSIVGGYSDVVNGGKAYIENYNSVTHVFSDFRSFSFNNDPSFITHFEGISAVKGGFSISATETSSTNLVSGSYAFIPVETNGTFGSARWVAMGNNINGEPTTGDTVIDYSVMGIYPNGSAAASFISTLPSPLEVPTAEIQPIFPANYGPTGIRQASGGNVIITGYAGTADLKNGATGFVYSGPLSQFPTNPNDSSLHPFTAKIPGETVVGSFFYGPNTPLFDPGIGAGNFTAVGAYLAQGSSFQNGMLYSGPLDNSGTYTKIVAPGNGTDPVAATIPHSTMGNLVVGNFDYQNEQNRAHAFIYDKSDKSYITVDRGLFSTTIYGIWQNGGSTSTKYTIAGGFSDVVNGGKGFIENYDSSTHFFSNFTSFSFNNDPTFVTHFEGISAVKGGFAMAATQASLANLESASYAFIPVNPDGTFGTARWVAMQNHVNGAPTTGNTVIDSSVLGIFPETGGNSSAYIATVSPKPLTPPNIVASPISSGLGKLTVFNPDGTVRTVFSPYGSSYLGGITVAQGDVNGDGMPDLITGTTQGASPHVKVFDGKTLVLLQSFYAYQQTFLGGVNVAAGDINGDGHADIITGAGPGGGPHVKVFDGATGKVDMSFFAYSANFTGGVHVAAGDVNGDGSFDIITGTGAGGGPHVKVFSGLNGSTLFSFMAYSTQFLGGVNVGSGDLDGDGKWDIITGPGAGGGPNVKVFSGSNGNQLKSFFAFNPTFTGGVMVSAGDMNFDGKADILTGAASLSSELKTFDGITLELLKAFTAFSSPLGVGLAGSK